MNIVVDGAPDKAAAVVRLVERSGAGGAIFLGDDVNDEPVFARAVPEWLTVKVGRDRPVSLAMYYLDDLDEVASLLERILTLVRGQAPRRGVLSAGKARRIGQREFNASWELPSRDAGFPRAGS
jgi:trehalose 6-phosphate phosphatase